METRWGITVVAGQCLMAVGYVWLLFWAESIGPPVVVFGMGFVMCIVGLTRPTRL